MSKSSEANNGQEVIALYKQYLDLDEKIGTAKKAKSVVVASLTKEVLEKYPVLSEKEVKHQVVDCKWMGSVLNRLHDEMTTLTQRITDCISSLAERYAATLGETTTKVNDLEKEVLASLHGMGFVM